tara:strand:- start:151 stop:435 length:285 start_codon:yes stop_codon:yes gene_type:complete
MTETPIVPMDYDAHTSTYDAFVRWSTGGTLACLFLLVGLVGFGIGQGVLIYLVATFGMIAGFGASAYGAASKQNSWVPSVVLLVLMGLLTAVLL